jgi:ABC-type phosphate/phosphonate transport system substrate-binding protein
MYKLIRWTGGWPRLGCLIVAASLFSAGVGQGDPPKDKDMLKIGTTGKLAEGTSGGDEQGALETLHKFVQSETGFDNEMVVQNGWEDLAKQLSEGEVQVGVFPGYEYAAATAKYPKLRVLALAANGPQPYRYAYLITRKDAKFKSFDDLKGQTLEIPKAAHGYQDVYLEAQAKKAGAKMKSFFGKITYSDNAEDAADDVVDGTAHAACIDRAALEAYKRRKPGRFGQLKQIGKSEIMPPTVIACYDDKLPAATQKRFTSGLLNANQKEKGRTLMAYFKMTAFVKPPEDFERVLAETRKNYPTGEATE